MIDSAIVWFRQDLRLSDNPALQAALKNARTIVPVYIYASDESGKWPLGQASCWWLHHSLHALAQEIESLGNRLIIKLGPTLDALLELIEHTHATQIYCNALYEPAHVKRDAKITQALAKKELSLHTFHGNLLAAPHLIRNGSDAPYRVFTPFYRLYLKQGLDTEITPRPTKLPPPEHSVDTLQIDQLALLPSIPWYTSIANHWQPGAAGAKKQLQLTCKHKLLNYPDARDFPAEDATSRLSPHLHLGEISPRQILVAANKTEQQSRQPGLSAGRDALVRQLVWRDFAHHVLTHFPQTERTPFNPRYQNFPWKRSDKKFTRAWQSGNTGIPIVDAGMRELWETGTMHNRVRMIVASLLTKNANLHWLIGARWFWDTLVDADLANNSMNWQWVAGCGVDASPYFRIFNPVTQSKKFDAEGAYLRCWIPELTKLPNRYIHEPWSTPMPIQRETNTIIGKDYPSPIIDISASRNIILDAFHHHQKKYKQ